MDKIILAILALSLGACSSTSIGYLHSSYHFERNKYPNEVHNAIFMEHKNIVVGRVNKNSWNKESWLVGYNYTLDKNWSISAGAATGYQEEPNIGQDIKIWASGNLTVPLGAGFSGLIMFNPSIIIGGFSYTPQK